nr:putative ribonuclease H-like domain-containing protein [Tanacetum cinerariifolium]
MKRVVTVNNYTRVHPNYSTRKTHPSAHRNMDPRAVLMETGLRPLNTARPVNTAHPKTTVYSVRPMLKAVNTAKPKAFNTARPSPVVVNAVRANKEVIEFGDSYKAPPEETTKDKGLAGKVSASTNKKGRTVAITAEDMQNGKNDVKARTTLLLALLDEHQLRFSKYDSAKELWEAILKTFGGNKATKKTKKNQLKQQYGNFKAEGSETLEQTFNRLQAIVSHLEFMDILIEQDDLNQKFLTSLAPEWLVLLESQKLDKDKKGVGFNEYCAVPPPPVQVYSPPKKDMSWMGLTEFVDDTVIDYTRPTPSIDVSKSVSKELEERWKSNNPSFFEQGGSSGNVVSKPMIKFMKESGCPNATKVNNTKNARKPAVKYAEIPKIPTVGLKVPAAKPTVAVDKGNKGKAVKASARWIWNMTGNISYLSEYVPFNGGYVLFGHGRGNITGKGLIKTDKSMLWHRRLGHLNFKTINKLVRSNLVKGLPSKSFENDHSYVACLKGKQHKASCKSKFSWSFFLKSKDETSRILKDFITEIENLKDLNVKIIRTDNGGEFRNKEMDKFCSRKGVKREFSNARTPEQNGVAERRNRTLIEAARTMVLVIKPHNKIPYELCNERSPAIRFLRPFGYHVMILNTLDHLGKFDAKGDEGYFVGYSLSSKAFKVFNKRTKKIEENLHVDFLENRYIEKGSGPDWLFDIDSLTNSMNYVLVVVAGTSSTNISSTKEDVHKAMKEKETPLRFIALPNWFHEAQMVTSNEAAKKDDAIPDNNAPQKEQEEVNGDKEVPESSGNSNLTASIKVSSNDSFELASSSTVETKVPTISILIPSGNAMSFENRLEDFFGDTSDAVSLNDVEVDLSNMETAIQVSTTHTLRIHKDHPKSQIISPIDTPVQTRQKAKNVDEQSFIAIIYQKTNPDLLQLCLFSCFLSQEEPKKIVDALKDPSWVEAMQQELLQVYKVEKAMYGLHQAPRAWYGTLSKYLLDNGFQRGTIDQTLFIRKHKGEFFLVQVYVDDIKFYSSNPKLCREFEALMHDKFQMSAMGELNFFLGLQVLQKKDGIFVSQDKYGKDGTGKDVELHLYRSMIGSLMYLTTSRPDIIFAIYACARHQVTPKECHLHAVKRSFRYLKGHPKLGLWYPKESPFNLVAYSDSDYGGPNQDRKSTTRGCQFLERRLISWQCKKQTIVATFTTEAEYVVAESGCGQVL